jgi:hypothetical protein
MACISVAGMRSLLEWSQEKREMAMTNLIKCGLRDGTYNPHASLRHVRYRIADVCREAHVVPTKQCTFVSSDIMLVG